MEEFYGSFERTLKQCKAHEINMEDMNAKIGQGRSEQVIGPFGLGDKLVK